MQKPRLLSAAGRLDSASKPILEINPRNARIAALAQNDEADPALRQDLAHMLYDEARVLDGDKPLDAKAFAERLGRIVGRVLSSAKQEVGQRDGSGG